MGSMKGAKAGKEVGVLDQASTVSLVMAVGSISAVVFGYAGYSRGSKKDSYSAGTARGTLVTDIEYIKHRTDDVLLEQKDTNKSINALSERVTRVEESTKSAHKRLDTIEEKGEGK